MEEQRSFSFTSLVAVFSLLQFHSLLDIVLIFSMFKQRIKRTHATIFVVRGQLVTQTGLWQERSFKVSIAFQRLIRQLSRSLDFLSVYFEMMNCLMKLTHNKLTRNWFIKKVQWLTCSENYNYQAHSVFVFTEQQTEEMPNYNWETAQNDSISMRQIRQV